MTDLQKIDAYVDEALRQLPGWVHEKMTNIEILLVDDPHEVEEAEYEDLLGLYLGSPLTERDANHVGDLPDVIYIFRRPHLELGLTPAALRDEVKKTLYHEIAHYFGMDDDYLDEIGWG